MIIHLGINSCATMERKSWWDLIWLMQPEMSIVQMLLGLQGIWCVSIDESSKQLHSVLKVNFIPSHHAVQFCKIWNLESTFVTVIIIAMCNSWICLDTFGLCMGHMTIWKSSPNKLTWLLKGGLFSSYIAFQECYTANYKI